VFVVGAGGDVSVKAGRGSGDAPVGGSLLLQSGAGKFAIVTIIIQKHIFDTLFQVVPTPHEVPSWSCKAAAAFRATAPRELPPRGALVCAKA